VLGSQGFIGQHMVSGLNNEQFDIYGADLYDIYPEDFNYFRIGRLNPDFDVIFKNNQFDFCINAAGSGSVPGSFSFPEKDFEANVIDSFKLLNTIRLYNPECRYIHFSSAAVYGNPNTLPVNEEAEISPMSPYGFHKWASEIICRQFSTLYDMKIVILRPFSAYGPGLRKQLIWDLFQKSKSGGPVVLAGSGYETRDFVYADDIVEVIRVLIKHDVKACEVFNVGSGSPTTIRHLSEVFNKAMGISKPVSFSNIESPGTPKYWQADIAKISSLGYQSRINLETGISKTIDWLKEHG